MSLGLKDVVLTFWSLIYLPFTYNIRQILDQWWIKNAQENFEIENFEPMEEDMTNELEVWYEWRTKKYNLKYMKYISDGTWRY